MRKLTTTPSNNCAQPPIEVTEIFLGNTQGEGKEDGNRRQTEGREEGIRRGRERSRSCWDGKQGKRRILGRGEQDINIMTARVNR